MIAQSTERKRKTKHPCPACGLHPLRCLCASVPRLSLATRVCVVVHAKELKRTTNTGRLAVLALANAEMRVRGDGREALDLGDLLTTGYRSFLFYPSAEARELTPALVAESRLPIQLIVPDGNWRQAGKVSVRHRELAIVPRVMVRSPAGRDVRGPALRAEHFAAGMATLEAIALALGVIEGPAVGAALTDLYRLKLERTHEGRGTIR